MYRNTTFAFVILALFGVSGCGYPEVSPQTYALSKALLTACNLKREEQLIKVDKMIESHLQNGEISASEAKWLQAISKQGHQGEWETAAAEARQLMKDQVNR